MWVGLGGGGCTVKKLSFGNLMLYVVANVLTLLVKLDISVLYISNVRYKNIQLYVCWSDSL